MFQAVARCLTAAVITRRMTGASTSNFANLGKWKKTQKELGEGKKAFQTRSPFHKNWKLSILKEIVLSYCGI